jgi:hypothetical protein
MLSVREVMSSKKSGSWMSRRRVKRGSDAVRGELSRDVLAGNFRLQEDFEGLVQSNEMLARPYGVASSARVWYNVVSSGRPPRLTP